MLPLFLKPEPVPEAFPKPGSAAASAPAPGKPAA